MSQFLKNHYQKIVTYDLLTKLNLENVHQINKINKISLNIGFKNSNIEKKKLTNIIVLLKLITNKEPLPTKSKKNNILLKIKKDSIVGCKITLRKSQIYFFLENFFIFFSPNIFKNKFDQKNKNNEIFNFQIKNVLNFFELKTEFIKFKNIPPIDISIHTNSKNNKELLIFLNSLLNLNIKMRK